MSSNNCLLFNTFSVTGAQNFNTGLGAVGFFIGLIIGFIVTFLLLWAFLFRRKFKEHQYSYPVCLEWFYCCYRCEGSCNCAKKSESMTTLKDAERQSDGYQSNSSVSSSNSSDDSDTRNKKKRLKHLKKQMKNLQGDPESKVPSEFDNINWNLANVDSETDNTLPLIDAIVQVTVQQGEKELLKQDFGATVDMEASLWQNRVMGLVGLCRLFLNKLHKNNVLEDGQKEQLSSEQLERLKSVKDKLDADYKIRFDKIMENKKLSPDARDSELADLSIWYANQLNDSLNTEVDAFQDEMRHHLKEQDLDELMKKLKSDLSKLDGKLAEQRIKQCANLEEVLAKRRQLLAEQKLADDAVVYEMEGKIDSRQRQFGELVKHGELSEKDKLAILNTYRRNLLKEKEAFEKAMLSQKTDLQSKLVASRKRRAADVERKNLEAKQKLLKLVSKDASVGTDEFINRFDKVLEEERSNNNEAISVLDKRDCDEFGLMRKDLHRDKEANERRIEDDLGNSLMSVTKKDESDIGRLLDLHKSQMVEFHKHKSNERRQQLMKLEEKLAKRQAEFTNDMESRESDLLNVKRQQELVLQKALTFQIDLDEAAKERLLQEHERNMLSMNNSLQISRLKQEKSLEQKIAERKAKISLLKKEQRDVRLGLEEQRQKDAERIDNDFEKKIQKEKDNMLAESRTGRAKLRDSLAKETEEAMRLQEYQLNKIIGKLQVGQIRRRNLIDKQERLIEELESELEKKLSGSNVDLNSRGLDQIMQNHFNNYDHLQDQLERSKKKQEKQLAEKLERQKLMKQSEVKDSIDKEENVVKGALERSDHGIVNRNVALMVLESALDAKYRTGMQELEEEIELEFMKQQNELDREMEEELQLALQDQRKKLFSQLANLTDMTDKEVSNLVEKAADATGSNKKLSRQVSRDVLGNTKQLRTDDRDHRSSSSNFPRPTSGRPPSSTNHHRKESRQTPEGRSSEESDGF